MIEVEYYKQKREFVKAEQFYKEEQNFMFDDIIKWEKAKKGNYAVTIL